MDDDRDMHSASSASGKIPNQKELEKELSEYLSKKYGDRVKIISPFVFPQRQEDGTDDTRQGKNAMEPAFDLLPEELEFFLDSFVVKQNHAKAVLATKVCTHFNRVKHLSRNEDRKRRSGVGMIKNNVLMIGPTGVGKTYIIKLIAQKLGVPFVKGDATKFSETGYVGGDVEDLVRDLYYEAGENIERAENGIIYVDEVDKIASAQNIIGHDVSRTGVQRALLKPMEETDVDLKVPHDPIAQIQAIEHYRRTGKKEKRVINTRNILFIMSGAFGGLADIIRKRLQKQGLGFEADVRSTDIPWEILKEVTAQDLIEFGFESEFVGRLPVVVVLDELTQDDLFTILENPNNPIIISKRLDFRAYGIDIKFEEAALRRLAAMAAAEKTGARGLVSVIEKVLIPFEKKLPSTGIREFLVTPEVVDRPEQELQKILADPDDVGRGERFARAREQEVAQLTAFIQERAQEFGRRSGLELTERRIALIAELYLAQATDINEAAEEFGRLYAQVKAAEASVNDKLDMELVFDQSAVDEILSQAIRTEQSPVPLTLKIAKSLEYGLNLVRDRSGLRRFEINAEAISDMDTFINSLIKQTYRQDCEALADIRRTFPAGQ